MNDIINKINEKGIEILIKKHSHKYGGTEIRLVYDCEKTKKTFSVVEIDPQGKFIEEVLNKLFIQIMGLI